MAVTVAICTFGDEKWKRLAGERAVPSAVAENVPVVRVHGETLQKARNEALAQCETEWVIFLDADDELEAGYVDGMLSGAGDVRAPRVRRIKNGRIKALTYMPRVWNHAHECVGDCLPLGNWVTVGALARTDLLREVGGWGDEAIYEDWALWLRCWKAGADIQPCHAAVYRYWYTEGSRNHSLPSAERDKWHQRIHAQVMGG